MELLFYINVATAIMVTLAAIFQLATLRREIRDDRTRRRLVKTVQRLRTALNEAKKEKPKC